MKKTITLILAASALTLALGATACNTGGISLGGTGDTPASSESVYGVSAATAGMLIQSMEAGSPASRTPESTPQTPETTLPETPRETPEQQPTEPAAPETTVSAFPELDGYMGLVDSFLNGSGYSVEVTNSDRAEYDEMMKISYSGLNGSTKYEMHYNKMLIPDFDDDDRWEDEEEEEYAIEGVLVIDGMEYPVQGVREIERERNEYESETQFRVTLENGRSVWVEQSESSEKDEHELEYSYLIRENGRVVERSSFSFEEEKGETELEMIAERNGKRESFSFEKETYRGREYIFLRVGSGRETKSYLVVSDGNGGYTYEEIRR
ncbi:MAG TPA: hypothetical protein H9797_06115 [Candidatus Gallimonas gallistercoris]|uniref:Uncharacterized protein n=1 Tax=Candidatus Gallimonas gallistercoris TaxID=2838602 RepID=A0A9D2KH68_9FIRM|nr:hypothetical protein [Candidatus Gallimonas gallistercoris]